MPSSIFQITFVFFYYSIFSILRASVTQYSSKNRSSSIVRLRIFEHNGIAQSFYKEKFSPGANRHFKIFMKGKPRSKNSRYLKSNLRGLFQTRSKDYFCFFFDSDRKIVFLILYRELFVTKPGALKICLFRAAFFIHRIASKKGLGGNFLDIPSCYIIYYYNIIL